MRTKDITSNLGKQINNTEMEPVIRPINIVLYIDISPSNQGIFKFYLGMFS